MVRSKRFAAMLLSVLVVSCGLGRGSANAQDAAPKPVVKPVSTHKPADKKPPRNKYGTPLDTLRETHLTTTVPEAEDFVRQSRPAAKDLDYTPLTGADPVRPKPRDKANIMALQAELEHAGAVTQAKGQPLRGGAKPVRKKAAE